MREDILQECGDVNVTTTDASTVLSGSVTDQAALLGWLERLRALGLDVVEFHRVLESPRPDEVDDDGVAIFVRSG